MILQYDKVAKLSRALQQMPHGYLGSILLEFI